MNFYSYSSKCKLLYATISTVLKIQLGFVNASMSIDFEKSQKINYLDEI